MKFKLYFQKLSLLQKIELYLLIIMFYGVILYFSNDIYNSFNKTQNNIKSPKVLQYQKSLKIINSKITTKNKIAIVNIIEQNNSRNNIFTESINIQDYKVNLKLSGSFIDIINILNFYQTHFLIVYYRLDNVSNKTYCDIKLDIKYIFNENKKNETIKTLSNPFLVKKVIKIKKVKKKVIKRKPLKISAIVSSEVLINNSWYVENDIINNRKIIKVGMDSVEILDIEKNKRYTLRVHNE
ncbi:MAG: hypothetical protein U9N59_05605 [Campylobacterota bacterium]|nr:hypothetical protein [Campylobacterota bacterium]